MILETETNTEVDKMKLQKRSLSFICDSIRNWCDCCKKIFFSVCFIFLVRRPFLKRICLYEFFTSTFKWNRNKDLSYPLICITWILLWIFLRLIAYHLLYIISICIFKFFANLLIFCSLFYIPLWKEKKNFVLNERNIILIVTNILSLYFI